MPILMCLGCMLFSPIIAASWICASLSADEADCGSECEDDVELHDGGLVVRLMFVGLDLLPLGYSKRRADDTYSLPHSPESTRTSTLNTSYPANTQATKPRSIPYSTTTYIKHETGLQLYHSRLKALQIFEN